MVYESDFYTTRRPYSRPLTSYSVTVSILRVWLLFLRQESGLEVCLNNVFATCDELTSRKRESPVCERKCTIPRNRQTKATPYDLAGPRRRLTGIPRVDIFLSRALSINPFLFRFLIFEMLCPKRRSIDVTRRDFQ